jgi:GNAT superfamily N-acetyltransferase
MNEVAYREMHAGEETAVCDLVLDVFDRFVAAQFSQEGIDEFREYVRPEALAKRTRVGSVVFLAAENSELLGMVEVRNGNHISLLFVRGRHQGRGVGRGLMVQALQRCSEVQGPALSLTVHASPNSVAFYRKVGFEGEASERIENGIRYTPMRLNRSQMT